MRASGPIVVAAIAALSTHLAHAQLEDDLRSCAAREDADSRLACYDAVAAALEGAQSSEEPSGQEEAGFGLPDEPDERDEPEEIVTRYVGEFRGWSGDTIFRLENGQVWRQSGPGRVRWSVENPVITIRRGRFGSFFLGVEGINAQVRVRRVE